MCYFCARRLTHADRLGRRKAATAARRRQRLRPSCVADMPFCVVEPTLRSPQHDSIRRAGMSRRQPHPCIIVTSTPQTRLKLILIFFACLSWSMLQHSDWPQRTATASTTAFCILFRTSRHLTCFPVHRATGLTTAGIGRSTPSSASPKYAATLQKLYHKRASRAKDYRHEMMRYKQT